ncbi:MAG: putative lipid flippase MurJ [Acidimicrobiales bacterium]|nr:putative lipid flippase MurJ [Acidimicrobiales bacterium]
MTADPLTPTPAGERWSRSTGTMAIGTTLSRVTGFGRLIALTYALGAGAMADAYNLANTLPNVFYDLVLGGILAQFIVPVFVDQLVTRGDDEDGWHAISAVTSVAIAMLVGATVVVIVAAPAIIAAYGVPADQQAIATLLLRMFAPQILFYGLTALGSAVLNVRHRFFAPAVTPVLNNLVTIGVLVALPHLRHDLSVGSLRHDSGLLWFLGLGTTAGVGIQAVALWPAIGWAHAPVRWVWDLHHPAVRTVARLSGWTLGYVATNQLAFLFASWLAARKTGGISAYQYAWTLFMLPYGILAFSLLTALMPDLSTRWSEGDREGHRRALGLGLRGVTLLMLPCAAGMAILARPVVQVLLQHGQFTGQDTALTGDVLALFAIGLPFFAGYLLLIRGYTSMLDTRTPCIVNAIENGLNIVFDVVLYQVLGARGLALGFSLAYVCAFVFTAVDLSGRLGGLGGSAVPRTAARIGTATAAMAVVVALVNHLLPGDSGAGLVARLVVAVVAGVSVFGLAARLLGNELALLLRRT